MDKYEKAARALVNGRAPTPAGRPSERAPRGRRTARREERV